MPYYEIKSWHNIYFYQHQKIFNFRPTKKLVCASVCVGVAQSTVDLRCDSALEFGWARASDFKHRASGGWGELTFDRPLLPWLLRPFGRHLLARTEFLQIRLYEQQRKCPPSNDLVAFPICPLSCSALVERGLTGRPGLHAVSSEAPARPSSKEPPTGQPPGTVEPECDVDVGFCAHCHSTMWSCSSPICCTHLNRTRVGFWPTGKIIFQATSMYWMPTECQLWFESLWP